MLLDIFIERLFCSADDVAFECFLYSLEGPSVHMWVLVLIHPTLLSPCLLGPSTSIDTACSSSLLALENAFQAIRHGQCDAALVGGVNLLLKPNTSVQFMKLGMLSPEGTCKSFDSSGKSKLCGTSLACIPACIRFICLFRSLVLLFYSPSFRHTFSFQICGLQ